MKVTFNSVMILVTILCVLVVLYNVFTPLPDGSGRYLDILNNGPLIQHKGSYTYYKRYLYLSDFAHLEADKTTREGIIDSVGPSNGAFGSGYGVPYYQLVDNSLLLVYLNSDINGTLRFLGLTDRYDNHYRLNTD